MTNKTKKNEKLSAEKICKILHISKRKCAWMLQNGMIPCKDSGKKTAVTPSCGKTSKHT